MAVLHVCTILLLIRIGATESSSEFPVITVADSIPALVKWDPATSWQHPHSNDNLHDDVVAHFSKGVRASIQANVAGFITALHPIFAGTPKNEFGLLGHAATRYTLNRLFVQRHGWFVNGLYMGLGTKQLNETSATDALLQYVPRGAQHAFERRLSGHGLDEQDVALLAATIENVIFEDAVQELRMSFNLSETSMNESLTTTGFDELIKFFMATRITELNKMMPELTYFSDWEALVLEMYPTWPYTVQFLRQLRIELFANSTIFNFADASQMAREIEGRWARATALEECQQLKTKLVALEEGTNTGCVRLSDFYKRSLDPKDGWQFKESPAYLKELGALDVSNPANIRLIIPNYINAPGNCVPSSKYYMACCINECEELQLQIERALEWPDGSPETIAAIVKKMLAGTNGVLSSSLIQRLIDISELHDGRVLLQSRLFAQWMHFVYPQQCPFPHVAGTTSDTAPDLYSTSQVADDETIQHFIIAGRNQTTNASVGTCMRWRDDEEIFVPTFTPQTTSIGALEKDVSVWTSVYFVAALMSTSLYLARLLTVTGKAAKKLPQELQLTEV